MLKYALYSSRVNYPQQSHWISLNYYFFLGTIFQHNTRSLNKLEKINEIIKKNKSEKRIRNTL